MNKTTGIPYNEKPCCKTSQTWISWQRNKEANKAMHLEKLLLAQSCGTKICHWLTYSRPFQKLHGLSFRTSSNSICSHTITSTTYHHHTIPTLPDILMIFKQQKLATISRIPWIPEKKLWVYSIKRQASASASASASCWKHKLWAWCSRNAQWSSIPSTGT